MFKPQMRFQKVLFIVLLIMAAATFFYSLGITTDLYPLYLSRAYDLEGSEIYYDIQGYNNTLVGCSIGLILLSIVPFVLATSTRRKYYVDNYIGLGVQGLGYVAYSIFVMVETARYKNRFLTEVNWDEYVELCQKKGWNFSGTTIWFDLGYVIGAILIVAALVLVADAVWKAMLVKKENELLAGGASDAE